MRNHTKEDIAVDYFEEAIQQLERATIRPFFYTRLMAKMPRSATSNSNTFKIGGQLLRQPKTAVLLVACCIVLNLTIIVQPNNKIHNKENQSVIAFFAEEYNLTISSFSYTQN